MKKTKLFFLVEYGTDNYTERRHLFQTNDEAKNFCKKELCAQYDKKSGYWLDQYMGYGAKIITLELENHQIALRENKPNQ